MSYIAPSSRHPLLRHFSWLITSNPRQVEFWFHMVMFWFGAWLANPAWKTFGTSGSWRMLRLLSPTPFDPEFWWGMMFVSIGGFGVLATIINRLGLRTVMSLLASAMCFLLAWNLAKSSIESTGVPVYFIFAIAQAWCCGVLRVYMRSTTRRLE